MSMLRADPSAAAGAWQGERASLASLPASLCRYSRVTAASRPLGLSGGGCRSAVTSATRAPARDLRVLAQACRWRQRACSDGSFRAHEGSVGANGTLAAAQPPDGPRGSSATGRAASQGRRFSAAGVNVTLTGDGVPVRTRRPGGQGAISGRRGTGAVPYRSRHRLTASGGGEETVYDAVRLTSE